MRQARAQSGERHTRQYNAQEGGPHDKAGGARRQQRVVPADDDEGSGAKQRDGQAAGGGSTYGLGEAGAATRQPGHAKGASADTKQRRDTTDDTTGHAHAELT